jgi:hypothetical protein
MTKTVVLHFMIGLWTALASADMLHAEPSLRRRS